MDKEKKEQKPVEKQDEKNTPAAPDEKAKGAESKSEEKKEEKTEKAPKETEKKSEEKKPEEKPKAETPKAAPEAKKAPVKKPPVKKKSPVIVPKEKYLVTSSPHLFGKDNVSKIMWTVSACLAPAGIASAYIFGPRALFVIISAIIGAVGAEYVWQTMTNQKITIKDGSAFLTGLLLAYNLPPAVPYWIPFIGSVFAIIIVKQFFGGLGMNIFNPALAARGFLLASWPTHMTTWSQPALGFTFDLKTTATPLNLIKQSVTDPTKLSEFFKSLGSADGGSIEVPTMLKTLLIGLRGGCLGEVCTLLLIIGGLYLIYKKYIDWQVPVVYIGTVLLIMLAFSGGRGDLTMSGTAILNILGGGLILGAFYMATDYVTIPATVTGRMVFALGCGVLTALIRLKGGYPEGVCYSILIMNCFTPLIDDKFKPGIYGAKKEAQKA